MLFEHNPKYRCPSAILCHSICLSPQCNSFALKCQGCLKCIEDHKEHQQTMLIGQYLLRMFQRPAVDPQLMRSYEKLMNLLESDPSLQEFCQELPKWFMQQIHEKFQISQMKKSLANGDFKNIRWFIGRAMADFLRQSEKQICLADLQQLDDDDHEPHPSAKEFKKTVKEIKMRAKRLGKQKEEKGESGKSNKQKRKRSHPKGNLSDQQA